MNIGILNRDMQQKIAQAGVIERLNHGSPKPRQNRNADEERMNWQMRALQTDTNRAKTFAEISFLSNESHCSKTSMEKLKPIMLKEMKVPMIHTGRYLVCQCLCKPLPIRGVGTSVNGDKYFTSGISMLIQDINGDVEEVNAYNYLYEFANVEWMTSETIMIIKEPWLLYTSQNAFCKIPSIKVDSPSDIIFVDSADEEYLDKIGAKKWYIEKSKDAEVWQQKANECFRNRNFEKALFFYDRAIRCNPELSILYLNKSLTCLRTGAFYFAYEASKIGLEKGGDREKALYRMGQAAYGMREWQKAAELFISVLKEFPSNTNASGELKRATTRLSEQKHGKYDSKAMLLESQKEKAEFDIADYMGPIEIAEIPGKDISKGTLIGVSKAFSSGYSQDCDSKLFSMIKNSMASAHMQNKLKTMQNLQNNPKRSKEIYDLYSGDQTTAKKEEIPFGVIEASLIQKICALNQYGSGGDDDEADVNCHLFILSSYFNHSCLANAYRTYYGDVMVIHATQDIKKGDEIYLVYVDPLLGFSERKKKLSDWKFTCDCKLCEIDSKDPNCLKRDEMLVEFIEFEKVAFVSPKNVIAKGEPVLQKIRESYVNRNEFKAALAEMLFALSTPYHRVGNIAKCVQYLEEVLTLMDNTPLKHAIRIQDICVNLADCYSSMGKVTKFEQMIKKAMELTFCNDLDHFKLLYPEISHL